MVKTYFQVLFQTGSDLTDNDRYRIRELIDEAISDIAERYCADYQVVPGHFIPGPLHPLSTSEAWRAEQQPTDDPASTGLGDDQDVRPTTRSVVPIRTTPGGPL